MENKQTAVEWLLNEIEQRLPNFIEAYRSEFNQAKAMEREQIVEAHLYGLLRPLVDKPVIQAEEFYNETYKTPKP